MGLKFCSECGKLMQTKCEDGVSFFSCSFCGWVEELSSFDNMDFKEKISKKDERGVGIATGNASANYEFECLKCGHDMGEVFEKVSIISDEAEKVAYIKCGKCGIVCKLQ